MTSGPKATAWVWPNSVAEIPIRPNPSRCMGVASARPQSTRAGSSKGVGSCLFNICNLKLSQRKRHSSHTWGRSAARVAQSQLPSINMPGSPCVMLKRCYRTCTLTQLVRPKPNSGRVHCGAAPNCPYNAKSNGPRCEGSVEGPVGNQWECARGTAGRLRARPDMLRNKFGASKP